MKSEKCVYGIADDLRMIVCCYFRARYPSKYMKLLLRPTDEQELTEAKVRRIKSFWKDNMIGTEFDSLLYAADTGDHNFLKERINFFFGGVVKYESNQQVQVWWLGDFQFDPGWYDATVLSTNKDGSCQIMYRDGKKVNTHRTLLLTLHTSRTPKK